MGCLYHFHTAEQVGWLVGSFGFNGPLRQYFSLYRAVSQREGERGERIDESKNSKPPPPAPTASAIGPCPTVIKIVGRPGTGSLPSTIGTTRPHPRLNRKNTIFNTEFTRVKYLCVTTFCFVEQNEII